MKITFPLAMKSIGVLLILFQGYKYLFGNSFNNELFKTKSLVFEIAYLGGFNIFLLLGIFFIFLANKIRTRKQ
jgi:hypothetical protein